MGERERGPGKRAAISVMTMFYDGAQAVRWERGRWPVLSRASVPIASKIGSVPAHTDTSSALGTRSCHTHAADRGTEVQGDVAEPAGRNRGVGPAWRREMAEAGEGRHAVLRGNTNKAESPAAAVGRALHPRGPGRGTRSFADGRLFFC